MRIILKKEKAKLLVILLFIIGSNLFGADTLKPYSVGFSYYKTYDTTRLYVTKNDTIFRPLLIYFWYPSREKASHTKMNYKQYIDLASMREDFSKTQGEIDAYSYNFINAYAGFAKKQYGIGLNISTREILDAPVKASLKIPGAKGKFPVIIYAPSNSKTPEQNHIICELLASHGFYVISVASAGANSQNRSDIKTSILAQVQDMEFILNYMENTVKIKHSAIGLLDFSSGGLAASVFQTKHKVEAVCSLDGGQEYGQYIALSKIKDFDLNRTASPYCLIVNNNYNFSFYPYFNSIKSNTKLFFRMPYLDHNGFVSFWSFFNTCAHDTLKNNVSTSYQYICEYTVTFFDAYLNHNKDSEDVLNSFSSQKNDFVIPEKPDYSQAANLLNTYLSGNSIDAAINIYKRNKISGSKTYNYSEKEIGILGRMLLDRDIPNAIRVFAFNTKEYPDSWHAYFDLAFAYKLKGDMGLAKTALLKAQKMNPENNDISKLMNELTKQE